MHFLVFKAFYGVILEKDESKKPEMLQEAVKSGKSKLDIFEMILKSNDGKYLVGTSLTWADVMLVYLFHHFQIILGVDLVEGYPGLQKLAETVKSTPAIKDWIAKSPKTKL